ncbi:MAG TPA: hypothetical protein VF791_20165 [Pyrinomonadaceae bacterium]
MLTSTHERILNAVEGRVHTWEELQQLTKLNSERLGFTLGELFDLRKIWTGEKNGVRVYGLERRTGLAPRFSPPQRRATDHA